MAIALDDRRDFVENVTRLSLWLAHTLRPTACPFYDFITGRTPIYRLTTCWDGRTAPPVDCPASAPAGWQAAITALSALSSQHASDADLAALEAGGLNALRPILEPRLQRDVDAWPWLPSCLGAQPPETGVFGFFLYEFDPGNPDHVILHMGNSLSPESPFAEPSTRARELLSLLDDALARNSTATQISSTSWLSCFEPFQTFFPPEWVHSAVASPPGYTYDWWGQFVTRRGAFHRVNGGRLRRTGRFPYPSVTCSAPIASVRQHLEARISLP